MSGISLRQIEFVAVILLQKKRTTHPLEREWRVLLERSRGALLGFSF
jgi:hypothetical protein